MKSIMQEASSIFKAVEKAWERAEKPNSFSVKVLEEPVKNFFGMTVKSAKIALYFDESPVTSKPKQHTSQPQPQREPKRQAPATQPAREPKKQQVQQPKTAHQPTAPVQVKQHKPTEESAQNQYAAYWNETMIAAAQNWIQGMLRSFGKDIRYTISNQNNQLTIIFQETLTPTGKDKLFFGSLAYLLMQAIRHQFKSDARGLKVLLTIA